ncbi:MAG TPA: DUF1376 domain-containing protein [Puia sp.]|jgi:uncharacterized protein YdaU (DUF1376 family)|nr:DUF1376 domain-containing protein [Puia sp.]
MSEGNYFFKFKYQRFLTSTLGWKEEEQGAYLRLLIVQFDQGAIPSDLEEIASISPAAKKHWPKLSKKFTNVDPDGRLYNLVMRQEWNKANGIKAANKENGSKGGRPKKQKNEAEEKPNGFNEETERFSENNQTDIHTNMVNGLLVNGYSEIKNGQPIVSVMSDFWMVLRPDYPFDQLSDLQALFDIGEFLSARMKIKWLPDAGEESKHVLAAWQALAQWITSDEFYSGLSLGSISKTSTIQSIWQKSKKVKNGSHKQNPTGTQFSPALTTPGSFGKL